MDIEPACAGQQQQGIFVPAANLLPDLQQQRQAFIGDQPPGVYGNWPLEAGPSFFRRRIF
jgi:hypothetical protein